MPRDRFSHSLGPKPVAATPFPPPASGAFLAIPTSVQAACCNNPFTEQLYQWAFERAQAQLAPSWSDRDVLASWN